NNPVRFSDPLGLWGVEGSNPNINTVICDGNGGFDVQLGGLGNDPKTAECDRSCTLEHEMSHLRDVSLAAPGICKGQPRGAVVKSDQGIQNLNTEVKATAAGLKCLRDFKLTDPKDKCKCQKIIDRRIEQE